MNWIRDGVMHFLALVFVLSLLYALAPRGRVRSLMRYIGGLALMLAVLQPLASCSGEEGVSSPASWSDEIDRRIAALQEDNGRVMAELISERLGSYIADKGSEYGLAGRPEVITEVRDGIPYPVGVVMDVPRRSDFSAWIEAELGIAAERQRWQGG